VARLQNVLYTRHTLVARDRPFEMEKSRCMIGCALTARSLGKVHSVKGREGAVGDRIHLLRSGHGDKNEKQKLWI